MNSALSHSATTVIAWSERQVAHSWFEDRLDSLFFIERTHQFEGHIGLRAERSNLLAVFLE
jgi:hypothetical protein